MSRQKKRTLRKYNKSRKKNNTLRKTRKKRVRKTHKKRMKGGSSRVGLISGTTNPQPTSERVVAPLQKLQNKAGSFIQSQFDTPPVSPTAFGYGPVPDALPSPEPIQPPAVTQPKQVVAPSSNQSKNKEVLKHVASGLGGATIALTPMGAAAAAAGALGAYGTYKAGQGAYRVIGSAKDKLKSKALIKNIEQCLKILVNYAVIDRDGEEAILKRLRKNSGYFDKLDNAPKITFDGEERRAQKNLRDTAKEANLAKRDGEKYGLNISETPEVVVEAPPPDPYFSLPTDDTPATTPTDVTQETSAFDFLNPQPAGAGFKAALDVN